MPESPLPTQTVSKHSVITLELKGQSTREAGQLNRGNQVTTMCSHMHRKSFYKEHRKDS